MRTVKFAARILVAFAIAPGSALAQTAMTPAQIASAVQSEDFSVPSPGEFFAAMDKVGAPAWSQHVAVPAPPSTDERERIALALGALVADGYVAVEAQDGQAVKNVGKEILSLAKRLNVSQTVLGRAGSISDFADASDWNALREEIEATQNEVKLDMAEQKDDRLVTLVTAAAWVRGIDLASGLASQNYAPGVAMLLHQPAVAGLLIQRIDALPEATRNHQAVASIRAALEQARTLVEPQVPTAEQAAELHRLMSGLVRSFTAEDSTSSP